MDILGKEIFKVLRENVLPDVANHIMTIKSEFYETEETE